jgi:acetolactate synthase-1/2/3 large subunit
MPDWARLFDAYGVPVMVVGPGDMEKPAFRQLFDAPGPAAFVVRIDPEQSYFPKISSRTTASGGMESNPLHLMSPFLSEDVMAAVCPHLKD